MPLVHAIWKPKNVVCKHMKIVLTNQDLSKVSQKSSQQLTRMWKKAHSQRKRNQQLENQLEKLLKVYHTKVYPVERDLLFPAKVDMVERLIDMLNRKSLANWHRDEMHHWIIELLDDIGLLDEEAMDILGDRYDGVVAEMAGISVEELHELRENKKEEFKNIFKQMVEQDLGVDLEGENLEEEQAFNDIVDIYEQRVKELEEQIEKAERDPLGLEDQEEEETEIESSESFYTEVEEEEETVLSQEEIEALNQQWLRKIFRKAARALHPDREQNPDLREQKQDIMAELAHARDNEDILTVVSLYVEHAGDGELSLSEEEMNQLYDLLETQLFQLEFETENIIDQSPIHRFVFDHLYASSQQARNQRLKDFLVDINDEADYLRETFEYLRNLECLKEVLVDRQDFRIQREEEQNEELYEEEVY